MKEEAFQKNVSSLINAARREGKMASRASLNRVQGVVFL
jgi:hypothetical protein